MNTKSTPLVEWDMSNDRTILPIAQRLRSLSATHYHRGIFEDDTRREKWVNDAQVYWRRKVLEKATLVMGKNYEGVGAEIGTGTGMYTAILSKIPTVRKIYAIEYSRECIENLTPAVFEKMDADTSKIVRVLGSFNQMEFEDGSIDFLFGMGSLHHSEDLSVTAKECYRVLRPGGWLIASERAGVNTTSNAEIEEALNREWIQSDIYKRETLGANQDEKITRAMNSEHEPRLCEYEADLARAGFKVHIFIFVPVARRNYPFRFASYLLYSILGNYLLRKRKSTIYHFKVPYYPWFAKKPVLGDLSIDPLLLMCQK